jgi:hypothetical protein
MSSLCFTCPAQEDVHSLVVIVSATKFAVLSLCIYIIQVTCRGRKVKVETQSEKQGELGEAEAKLFEAKAPNSRRGKAAKYEAAICCLQCFMQTSLSQNKMS